MGIKIIKSKTRKRSIQISIDKNRQITVKAHFKTKDSEIEKFLKEHKDWIEKTLSKIPVIEKKKYENGEMFLFMGRKYPLVLKEGKRNRIILHNEQYIYFGNPIENEMKIQFEKFYKKFGKEYSLIKSREYADLINKNFNRISSEFSGLSLRLPSCLATLPANVPPVKINRTLFICASM